MKGQTEMKVMEKEREGIKKNDIKRGRMFCDFTAVFDMIF